MNAVKCVNAPALYQPPSRALFDSRLAARQAFVSADVVFPVECIAGAARAVGERRNTPAACLEQGDNFRLVLFQFPGQMRGGFGEPTLHAVAFQFQDAPCPLYGVGQFLPRHNSTST